MAKKVVALPEVPQEPLPAAPCVRMAKNESVIKTYHCYKSHKSRKTGEELTANADITVTITNKRIIKQEKGLRRVRDKRFNTLTETETTQECLIDNITGFEYGKMRSRVSPRAAISMAIAGGLIGTLCITVGIVVWLAFKSAAIGAPIIGIGILSYVLFLFWALMLKRIRTTELYMNIYFKYDISKNLSSFKLSGISIKERTIKEKIVTDVPLGLEELIDELPAMILDIKDINKKQEIKSKRALNVGE